MLINSITNPFNIYLVLWTLHYLTGMVFMPGTIYSALVSLFLLLFTIFYSIKAVIVIKFPTYIKVLWLFGCLLLFYGVILMETGNVIATAVHISDYTYTGLSYIRTILNSIFPIFVFYYFFHEGYVSQKTFHAWIIVLFCTATIFYFHKRANMLAVLDSLVVQRDGFTNNAAYAITALLPLVLYLSKRQLVQITVFGLCLFMIFMGVKRGAILISMVIFVFYCFTIYMSSRSVYRLGFILILNIFIYFAYLIYTKNFAINDYFLQRINQTAAGDVNGRDIILSSLLNVFYYDYNTIELFFGRGAYGSLKAVGQFAHNDWIEILISHGLVGIILYALFFIKFFSFLKEKREESTAFYSLIMVFTIIFMKTFFSMSFNEIDIWLGLALAYNTFKLEYSDEFFDSYTQLSYET